MLGMLLALVPADPACPSAGFKSGTCHLCVESRLAKQYLAGSIAYVGAVEAEADTASQHLYVPLSEAGVGAGGAGLGAVETGLDALHQSASVNRSATRVSLDHPLGVSHDFSLLLSGRRCVTIVIIECRHST